MSSIGYQSVVADIFPVTSQDGLSNETDVDFSESPTCPRETPHGKVGNVVTFEDGIRFAKLSSGNRIPLVGVGVGNSPLQFVGVLVSQAVQDDKRIRLIDTSYASRNEALVAEGILAGVDNFNPEEDGKLEVHVITKVWYTHLGYQRTKQSVFESLKQLAPALQSDKIDLKLHVLLHWPRCYDNVAWMDCTNEEERLPDAVKEAGPDPHLDPANAWKESWKFLEELYLSGSYPIESIGVSNFDLRDLEKMDDFARIHPHTLQTSVWSLLHDHLLIDYCRKHHIHVQVYNALQGTVARPGAVASDAFKAIGKVADELSNKVGKLVSPGQTVLAWLIQHGVSVMPRTSMTARLEENSALTLSSLPTLSASQVEKVAHAVEAYTVDDGENMFVVDEEFSNMSSSSVLSWFFLGLFILGVAFRKSFVRGSDENRNAGDYKHKHNRKHRKNGGRRNKKSNRRS